MWESAAGTLHRTNGWECWRLYHMTWESTPCLLSHTCVKTVWSLPLVCVINLIKPSTGEVCLWSLWPADEPFISWTLDLLQSEQLRREIWCGSTSTLRPPTAQILYSKTEKHSGNETVENFTISDMTCGNTQEQGCGKKTICDQILTSQQNLQLKINLRSAEKFKRASHSYVSHFQFRGLEDGFLHLLT